MLRGCNNMSKRSQDCNELGNARVFVLRRLYYINDDIPGYIRVKSVRYKKMRYVHAGVTLRGVTICRNAHKIVMSWEMPEFLFFVVCITLTTIFLGIFVLSLFGIKR